MLGKGEVTLAMEVLVLYCDTGGGHHTAALAMAEELKKRGHRVTMLDPFTLAGKSAAGIVGNSYIKLVQHSPKSFGALYALGKAYDDTLSVHSPVYWANGKLAEAMKDYLEAHPFEWIVTTHLFPAQIVTHLAQKQCALPKTLFISTDYTCIPFFEETNCDYYGIPAADLEDAFGSRGIPLDKMLCDGIPVRAEFTEQESKAVCRKQLGWKDEQKNILLSGGSMGAGQIVEAAAVLDAFLQANPAYRLTIVCGSNRKLYEHLLERYRGHGNVEILGYTDQMAVYIKAADVFITKPGGLSSTEAAVCGVPLIHLSPIPGCETSNAEYFSSHGMSLYVPKPGPPLLDALETFLEEGVCERMVLAQRRCINSHAASDYCDAIEARSEKG